MIIGAFVLMAVVGFVVGLIGLFYAQLVKSMSSPPLTAAITFRSGGGADRGALAIPTP
jgi:hypothetical protein